MTAPLSPTGDTRRYEKYVAWCATREIKAAPFQIWQREVAKISDYTNPNPFSYLNRQATAVAPLRKLRYLHPEIA